MRSPYVRRLSFLTALLICLLAFAPQGSGASIGNVLCVSDIHFDPLMNLSSSAGKTLLHTSYKSWRSIYSRRPFRISGYGEQTNFLLLDSVLKQMRETCPKPDFILFSGDLLAHNIRSNYKYIGNHYHQLIESTINFIAYEFNHYFPGVPVYFALGNNDHYRDYGFEPQDVFFRNTSGSFYSFFLKGKGVSRSSFDKMFLSAGNYSVHPVASPKNRIISLNNCFFSSSTHNKHGTESMNQIARLSSILASARANGQRVWILMHIPPGVDVRGTLGRHDHVFYWTGLGGAYFQSLLGKFRDLLMDYSEEIALIFSGHSHMDHFRLTLDAESPGSLVHITPAISPEFNNNPAFQVLRYNRQSFDVIDYDTFRYGFINGWAKEYNLHDAYKAGAHTSEAMKKVAESISVDPTARMHFTDFYNAGSRQFTISERWGAYWCGISCLTGDEFDDCYRLRGIAGPVNKQSPSAPADYGFSAASDN